MVEVELTWGRVIKVWWSLLWRYALYAFIFGLVVGFIVGLVVGFARLDKAVSIPLYLITVTLIALATSLWVVKKVLQKKRFGDFRIALLTDIEGVNVVDDTQTNLGFDIR